MVNRVVLSDAALKEIDKSFTWYEGNINGLGERFVTIIDKAFNTILLNPSAFPKKKDNYRDMVINKFPFIIVYEHVEKEDTIYILHVFHTSRNPKHKYRKK